MLRVLITAGPTYEPIDAVRFIGNRSSGRMGVAIASAARRCGLDVTLLLGPTSVAPPEGVMTLRHQSTADLERLLEWRFLQCDVLIMAAAVADYRPVQQLDGAKRPRTAAIWSLELTPTPDLVANLAKTRRMGQLIVAFALEPRAALAERAREKLQRKDVDAIVANPLETIDATDVEAVLYTRDEMFTPSEGPISKDDFADWLVRWIVRRVEAASREA